jgi:hypothetical protein
VVLGAVLVGPLEEVLFGYVLGVGRGGEEEEED